MKSVVILKTSGIERQKLFIGASGYEVFKLEHPVESIKPVSDESALDITFENGEHVFAYLEADA